MRPVLALMMLVGVGSAAADAIPSSHDRLLRANDVERRAMLDSDLSTAGLSCTGVTAAVFSGRGAAGEAFWDVRCVNGPMYRASVSLSDATPPTFLACGAAAPAPMSGPCFQRVESGAAALAGANRIASRPIAAPRAAAAGTQIAATSGALAFSLGIPLSAATPQVMVPRTSPIIGFDVRREAACTAQCGGRPMDRVSACMGICAQGGDPDAPPLGSAPDMTFGAVYTTAPPFGAIGFRNGGSDRLAVNVQAAAACAEMAKGNPCFFRAELVNRCGAVAQAIERHPNAVMVTSNINTFIVGTVTTGSGATRAEAEEDALQACNQEQNTAGRIAAGSGSRVCRVTTSGC